MGKLLVKDKEVVVPGEVIADGMDYLPSFGTYRQNEKIMANRLGLLSVDGKVVKTIAISGRYIPRRNDVIIGRVFDILMSGWRMDINSAYSAVLMMQEASFKFIQKGADLSKFFALDDYVVAKIIRVTSQNLIDLTMKGPGLRKLDGGKIISINTHKVPRVIGKQGSMVSMIKDATGCRITVGQNGLVWINGEPEQESIAVSAIKKIESEAHHPGLTDEIKVFLEKRTGKKIVKAIPQPENKPIFKKPENTGAHNSESVEVPEQKVMRKSQ
ncbi:KH domain-containing protein [archaeon]|nr:KH domain-containing protein [archaeon]MBL7056994.1 KH domain-containing protein [Candidatus Woesearchaeota archaeon]